MFSADVMNSKPQPLRETVRETLRHRIVEGHYAPGARLVERELAAEFDVSRLPVREALRMLSQEGLLSEPGPRGAEVNAMGAKDVEDLFEMRQLLESFACRLAAERATSEDLDKLAGLLDYSARCLARGAKMAGYHANIEFHEEIIRIANNSFLKSSLDPLQGRMHLLFQHRSELSGLIQEHRDLYEAIASGDPERAAAQAASHVARYRDELIRSLGLRLTASKARPAS
ncbi:GntR family transcriptional regulator [Arthrobacter sp. SW1]|nr:GntR family transcriptional regulator [Arthrobacter sp. SW1]